MGRKKRKYQSPVSRSVAKGKGRRDVGRLATHLGFLLPCIIARGYGELRCKSRRASHSAASRGWARCPKTARAWRLTPLYLDLVERLSTSTDQSFQSRPTVCRVPLRSISRAYANGGAARWCSGAHDVPWCSRWPDIEIAWPARGSCVGLELERGCIHGSAMARG